MLKILGAVLVIAAATVSGWLQARQYANRPHQIRKVILALRRLQTEIMYGFTPLPDALQRIGEQSGEPIKAIFSGAAAEMNPPKNRTAQDSLQSSIEASWRFTAMKAAEKDVLNQLSFTLGTSDRKDQLGHIATAVRQLESEEAAARDEQNRYEKMFKSLGLLCGAFIVILFY
ncbi:stage III sporulation protein AB [Fontibacillus phaseoli]|uniref:Stage III sporulation protein AB n=1 Tax=Fontibacillus phaseoli TaxID=1416533 RepID=A0A369BNG2_9BACL|nr:stage III sporulation protein SpoIIIAB [Fontibacillus phaseoli]RCX23140.1 stage III sporulation protein AB [Fontibacillus phaseoli]